MGGLALALPLTASAHRGWMVPSFTVLSGDGAWVTFDAAISNELFYADTPPMRLDGVTVYAPDGSVDKLQNALTGQVPLDLRRPADQARHLQDRLGLQHRHGQLDRGGEVKRFRGSPDDFAKQVPAGAADLKTIKSFNRNETFVTRDAPTDTVLKPTGKGLELVPVTHPNDLVAGEAATFKFLLDGKPAADLEVTFAPGNSRYRATPGDFKVKTGADGSFKVTFPEAGMYWLNATVRTGETGRGPGGPGGGPMGGWAWAAAGGGSRRRPQGPGHAPGRQRHERQLHRHARSAAAVSPKVVILAQRCRDPGRRSASFSGFAPPGMTGIP
jgi:hypothetical protein